MIGKQETERLYDAAHNTWGLPVQLDMLLEECSELIYAICKMKRRKPARGGDPLGMLVEEMADVEIMLEQIAHILRLEHRIQIVKLEKLDRLQADLVTANRGGWSNEATSAAKAAAAMAQAAFEQNMDKKMTRKIISDETKKLEDKDDNA